MSWIFDWTARARSSPAAARGWAWRSPRNMRPRAPMWRSWRAIRPRSNDAKAAIQAMGGKGKVLAISCDVSKAAAIEAACAQCNSEFGKVDIFVNNAGQSTRGPSETITDAQWQADLDLKLFAQIRFCRILLPQMKAAQMGPHHQRPQYRRQGAGRRQRADLGQPRRADGLHQGAVDGRRAAQRAGQLAACRGHRQ